LTITVQKPIELLV